MRISDQENKEQSSGSYLELLEVHGVPEMKWSQGGDFTKSLLSLQLQLKTLLEGVGGESTATLLDAVAQLHESERERIIPILSRVISRVVKGDKRLMTDHDKYLKDFEDSLFDSISSALGHSANDDEAPRDTDYKLEVVPGGKLKRSSLAFKKGLKQPSLIDLAKAREQRRSKLDGPPNEAS